MPVSSAMDGNLPIPQQYILGAMSAAKAASTKI